MTDPIALLGASLRADAEALRVTSQNVANLQTPGYRREVAVLESPYQVVAERLASPPLTAPITRSSADPRAGTLQQTGEAWNVALEGDGYFVIGTSAGDRLTRRGDFRLDATGKLVTYAGEPVLGTGGEITPPAGTPAIDGDGTIRIAGQVVDQLRRVTADPRTLVPVDNGNYTTSGAAPVETTANTVRQGFIETSNVSPVDELLRLLQTMRHFETAQHYVRGANDMLTNAITTLGRV